MRKGESALIAEGFAKVPADHLVGLWLKPNIEMLGLTSGYLGSRCHTLEPGDVSSPFFKLGSEAWYARGLQSEAAP